jgi:beta-lactamase regulating signal transducer with metallopeptidase domain
MILTLSLDTLAPLSALAPVLAAVASAALKGVLPVSVAALAAATVLRHRSAASRHAVWTHALAAHLLLVAAAPLLPAVSLPEVRLPAWLAPSSIYEESAPLTRATTGPRGLAIVRAGPLGTGPTAEPHIVIESTRWKAELRGDVHVTPSATASASASTGPAAPLTTPHVSTEVRGHKLTSHLPTLWLAGVLAVLARLLLGTARVRSLARAAERIADPSTLALAQRTANRLGIARPITLLRGDRLSIPVTWGVVYPTVLLPAESNDWPEERRRVVLVHEMAHVKRFDALTQLVAQLAIAIFWFDPLVWLAARRMRAEREHACDDYVLRDGARPSLYANELLEMVRRIAGRAGEAGAPAFAALAMARRSEFEGRMLAILDPVADRRMLNRAASAACAVFALVLLVPLAALRPSDARAHAAQPASAAVAAREPTITTPMAVAIDRRAAAAIASRRTASAATTVAAARARASAAVRRGESQEKLPIIYQCTAADVRTTNSTVGIHTDHERPGRNFIEYQVKEFGRCVHAVFVGRVTFTADERDIASLSPDGRVQLHERTLDWERALVVTSDADGVLRRVYTADGRPETYDASARAWVAGLIKRIARESGVDVPGRVSRLRSQGGVPGVLAEIGEIRSSGAKRKHYEALLAGGVLTFGEIDSIVRHAARQLAGSSGDLRAVLRQVPPGSVRTIDAALEEAIGRMSDGDKHHVLAGMLDSADPATLLVALRLAERIASDGDKSSFLRRAAPRVLGGSSALREAFFRAYATLAADGDKRAVLMAAVRQGQKSTALTRDVIRGTGKIGSDGDKTLVLLTVARTGLVTSDELREEYIKAARTIGSDGDYRRVIDAVLTVKTGG